jgi:hypothetical protein
MEHSMEKISVISSLLLSVALIPPALMWGRCIVRRFSLAPIGAVGLPMILCTLSVLVFVMELALPETIGANYTRIRFTVIYLNVGLAIVIAIVSLMGSRPMKWNLLTCALSAALVWYYLLVASSVV